MIFAFQNADKIKLKIKSKMPVNTNDPKTNEKVVEPAIPEHDVLEEERRTGTGKQDRAAPVASTPLPGYATPDEGFFPGEAPMPDMPKEWIIGSLSLEGRLLHTSSNGKGDFSFRPAFRAGQCYT